MPLYIEPNHLFTVAELEDYLKRQGVLSPTRVVRRLIAAGMHVCASHLILGQDRLDALAATRDHSDSQPRASNP